MPNFVIIESPYAGNIERNKRYLTACIADCFQRGEIPFASHGLYPGALDDSIPEERKKGIEAGFAVARVLASYGAIRAIYTDEGMSGGMRAGIDHARSIMQPVDYRSILSWLVAEGVSDHE